MAGSCGEQGLAVDLMKRILVVDDEPAVREPVCAFLRSGGFEVSEVSDGREGLETARRDPPDLVLADIRMSDFDGLELVRQLRATPGTASTPVILMTGNPAPLIMRQGMEAGADDFLAKPFSAQDLLSAVRMRLERHALFKQNSELRTQEELRESEARYRNLVECMDEGVAFLDEAQKFTFANSAAGHIFGLAPAELLGRSIWGFAIESSQAALRRELELRMTGQKTSYDLEIRRPDGEPRQVLITSAPSLGPQGQFSGSLSVFRDVTQPRQFEKALARERDMIQALMDYLPDSIYFKDLDSHFLRVNAAHGRLLGVSKPEDAIGRSDADFFPSIYAHQTLTEERLLLATGEPVRDRLEQLRLPSGQSLWLSATKAPIRNAVGEITGLVGVSRDITERRSADERLAKINECFLQFGLDVQDNLRRMTRLAGELLDASAALYHRTAGNVIVAWEPRRPALKAQPGLPGNFFKASLADADGRLFIARSLMSSIHAPELVQCGFESISIWVGLPVCLENKVAGCLSLLFEKRCRLTPSSERALGIIATAIRVEEERCQAQRERDVIETQLRQAHKLEAIGQLASGIAHEINTPAQYVGDNTRFLRDSFASLQQVLTSLQGLLPALKELNPIHPALAKAEAAVAAGDLDYLFREIPAAINQSIEGLDRITRIVRAMKEFSHPGGKEKTLADLNRAIESTATVARNEWKYVADLQFDLDPNLPPVPCLLGEFNQVILNLVINAAHAIKDKIKPHPEAKGRITISTRRDQTHAEIRVADTGSGIPEAVRPRIFEPFFTTKDVGKGTGQGLSMVYATVVKRHGGTVTFESQTGEGTTFLVRLPLVPIPDPGL